MKERTQEAIVSAFLDLAAKEPFDKITVTDIAQHCDISRQTFYYHFDSIEEMVTWMFRKETAAICSAEGENGWSEYAAMYTALFRRFDAFLKNAIASPRFILIYNLINRSFNEYLAFYLEKSISGSLGKNKDFFVACLAGAFTSMTMEEIQKPNSNYQKAFDNIRAAMQGVTL